MLEQDLGVEQYPSWGNYRTSSFSCTYNGRSVGAVSAEILHRVVGRLTVRESFLELCDVISSGACCCMSWMKDNEYT